MLLTPREVALLLKVHLDTLEQWRGRRAGPPWIKLGNKPQSPIRYRQADIEKYLQDQANK
jgi:hypothetical protein